MGKAFENYISTLDEEMEVQVLTLRLKSLNEIFDSKTWNNQNGIDNGINLNIIQDEIINKDRDTIINDRKKEIIYNYIIKKDRNLNDIKTVAKKDEIMRGTQNLNKNSIIIIHREEGFHISFKILNSKIPGEGNYQTSPENLAAVALVAAAAAAAAAAVAAAAAAAAAVAAAAAAATYFAAASIDHTAYYEKHKDRYTL